jgi:hypothetical protein
MERSAIRDSNAEQSGPGFRFAPSGLQGVNRKTPARPWARRFLFGRVLMGYIDPRYPEHQAKCIIRQELSAKCVPTFGRSFAEKDGIRVALGKDPTAA